MSLSYVLLQGGVTSLSFWSRINFFQTRETLEHSRYETSILQSAY